MSYVALYRKFRPSSFEEVKGQDAIVTTLRNQIAADHIAHAYLFCGTRGTGKTTVAKILARAVNCEHPVNGGPCNTCDTCRGILSGNSLNVIEIDAASNNGVDNIREIIEQVQYRPARGRYKVYIIDEVHMLSAGAFNALLKTLEEPPSYVIFVLATTEVSRIPLTILSRCQRYDFRRIEPETMVERMQELLQAEGAEAEEKALRYIARSADGAMRDALSLLDQCMSFYLGQKLTYENVLSVLGAVDTEVFRDILKALLDGDAAGAVGAFDQAVAKGRETGQFLTDFIWYLRNLLLIHSAGDTARDLIDVSGEQYLAMQEASASAGTDALMRMIRILSDLSNQMRFASNRRTLMEVALIRIARPETEASPDAVFSRMQMLERRILELEQRPVVLSTDFAVPDTGKEPASGSDYSVREEELPREEAVPAAPEDLQRIRNDWPAIVAEVSGGFRKQMLLSAIPKYNTREADGRLYLEFQDINAERYARDEELRQTLAGIIRRRYNKEVEIDMHLLTEQKRHLREIEVEEQLKRIRMPVEEIREDE